MKTQLTCKECGADLGRVFAYSKLSELRSHFRSAHPGLWDQYEEKKHEYRDFCRDHGIPSGLMI